MTLRLTFDGSFQRANVYKKNVSSEDHMILKNDLSQLLSETLNKIIKRKKYTDKDHFKTLERFSKVITSRHSKILYGGKLRIGSAQKMLNLYWKVSWLIKPKINTPIHCPFDSIIIKKLGPEVRHLKWTKVKRLEEYEALVKAAKKVSGKDESIAEWELRIYWKNRNND